jgi:hypothetical protein
MNVWRAAGAAQCEPTVSRDGIETPRSEYSPEPPPEERRKEPMAILLVYGARKEVSMDIIGEYFEPFGGGCRWK